jgi:lipopolysaccharide biosynthesis regulator YciM
MNLVLLVGGALFLLMVGTLLGRYYAPDKRPLKRAAREGRSYVRGLVEVLEGKDEAAIAEISKALRENTKTVEAYFALGALFRNRGEHERAVRVHQTILVRRDIDKGTRLRVHYQLALDFRAAGFARRAVKALEYVIAHDKKHQAALSDLARLYEQAEAWERAAAVQLRLGKLDKTTQAERERQVAHLFARRAHELAQADELRPARKMLRRAVSTDASSVHVLHVLADYERRAGKLDAAVEAWEKALQRAPDLAAFFMPRIEAALFELERVDETDALLSRLLDRHGESVHLRLAHARYTAKRDPERALAALMGLLDDHPNLLPARREAARIMLERDDAAAIRGALSELLDVLGRADRGYRCGKCGYADSAIFWRCPRCASWDSVRVAWGRRAVER